MPTFRDLLGADPLDMDQVGHHLDGLSHEQRVSEVRAIPGSLQARLYAAARGKKPLRFEHYVPAGCSERTFVRHYGKNSLPVFTQFEKRFARPAPDSPVLWGFNHSPLMGVVGPGHFVMRTGPDEGELHVDYYSVPSERLDGAPPLRANTAGLSRFVYGNMIDVLRGVSDHVSIGRAIRHGKDTPNYFLLCREG